jgi:uncharacterized protein (TIGR02611 family)
VSRNAPGDDPKPAKVGNSGTPGDANREERRAEQLRDASAAAFRKVEASAPPRVSVRLRALRERIRRHRSLDTAWRVMVFAAGCTLIVAGLMMFLLPGPGWATLILGLVVLASEFTWANRMLDPVKVAALRAKNAAIDPRRRRRNLILAATAGVLIGIVVVWYLLAFGLTLEPIMELAHAVLDWFTGLFR